MSDFITVARIGDIPEGEGRSYPVGGVMVAIFHDDGEYTAINDTCPHMGASLAAGHVENGGVICPWHAWKFSVKNGLWLDNPRANLRNDCYEVRIVGEDIQVRVPPRDDAAEREA